MRQQHIASGHTPAPEEAFIHAYLHRSPVQKIFEHILRKKLANLHLLRGFMILLNLLLSLFMIVYATTLATDTTLLSTHQERWYDLWGMFINISVIYLAFVWQPRAIFKGLNTLRLNHRDSEILLEPDSRIHRTFKAFSLDKTSAASIVEQYLRPAQLYSSVHLVIALLASLYFLYITLNNLIAPQTVFPGYTEHWWETSPVIIVLYVVLTLIPAYLVVLMFCQHVIFSIFLLKNLADDTLEIQYQEQELGLGQIKSYYQRAAWVVVVVGVYITLRLIPPQLSSLDPALSLRVFISYFFPFILNILGFVICIVVPLQLMENLTTRHYQRLKRNVTRDLEAQVDDLKRLLEAPTQPPDEDIEHRKNQIFALKEKQTLVYQYDVEWYSPLRQIAGSFIISIITIMLFILDVSSSLVELFG